MEIADVTKEDADKLGWEAPRGAKVVKPVAGGPADAAGLQAGDVLVSLDGMEIENVKAPKAVVGERVHTRRFFASKRPLETLTYRQAVTKDAAHHRLPE